MVYENLCALDESSISIGRVNRLLECLVSTVFQEGSWPKFILKQITAGNWLSAQGMWLL